MPRHFHSTEYEISTRNFMIKFNLNNMFDKYGIKDYAISTITNWENNPLEIFPTQESDHEKPVSKNTLESIDELVLYQYLRLEEEIANHPFHQYDLDDEEDRWKNLQMNDPFLKKVKDGFSYLYLVKEEKPDKSYQMFKGFLQEGASGLCISQCDPKTLSKSYGLKSNDIVRLCSSVGENNIDPKDLSRLVNRINEFIHENGNSVILIDGLEYLITQNGLGKVLEILNALNTLINKDSMFILPIHPKALRKTDLDQIEKSIEN